MRTIILNSNHSVSSDNNEYRYSFPAGCATFKNNTIGLSKATMYYSWENIKATNNGLSYTWVDGTEVTVDPDAGYYTVDDLNSYLQSKMISEGHYLLDSNGDYVYYLQLRENSVYYSVQIDCFAVPTSLPSGYTKAGTWDFPDTASTPQVTVGSICDVLGFTAGTYPTEVQSSDYSVLSDYTPQVTPVLSVYVTCSLVNNNLSIPSDLLYCFTPDVDYGSSFSIEPQAPVHYEIQDGSYNQLTVRFYDQDMSPLVIKDPNIVILLEVR